jgi:hypothetical protein
MTAALREPAPLAAEPPQAPALSYATPPPGAWIRRHRKPLLMTALLLAAAVVGWHFRQPITRWARWQYWMRRAAAHVTPPAIRIDDVVSKMLPA